MNKILLKPILILSIVFSLLTLTGCNYFNGKKVNVESDQTIFIRTGADYAEVLDSLRGKLVDMESFEAIAEKLNYPQLIAPGFYKLKGGATNTDLVNKLRNGEQDEIPVMVKALPTIFHMAGSISKTMEIDSTQLINSIMDWAHKKDPALTEETVKMFFLPETYNFYWNTSPDKFVERMIGEFDKIWTPERQEKADALGLTPLEVFTLASIVQGESSKKDEQPMVAATYLERLKKGMMLQADPTSVYAYKLQNGFNQKILRVTFSHLATASKYNTYKVTGLPPAPIALTYRQAVDAVLNPADEAFIFFCADPDRPGYHLFTNSYAEHQVNAKRYRAWLKEQGIR